MKKLGGHTKFFSRFKTSEIVFSGAFSGFRYSSRLWRIHTGRSIRGDAGALAGLCQELMAYQNAKYGLPIGFFPKAWQFCRQMASQLQQQDRGGDEGEMSFLDHLEALRWHIIRSLAATVILMVTAFFSKDLLFHDIILAPSRPDFWTYRMLCQLSEKLQQPFLCVKQLSFIIQSRTLTGQFGTHIGVSLVAGFVMAFPYIFWEIWRFVSPGLYPRERALTRGAVFFVSLLFFLGISFGYWILAPLSINFLANYQIDPSIANEVDLMSYIETLMMMVLSCGLMFQLPMVILVLARAGIAGPDFLREYRRHAIIVIVIVAAFLTPSPDLFSLLIVALPIYLLYELSILLAAREEQKQQSEIR